MDVTKEFILMAAGLIMTVSLIFAGFSVYRKASETGMILAERQEKKISAIADFELNKYEGLSINGSKILRYVKQMSSTYDADIMITVANPEEYTYKISELDSLGSLRKVDSKEYINPLRYYTVTVNKDDNAAVCSIEIKQLQED